MEGEREEEENKEEEENEEEEEGEREGKPKIHTLLMCCREKPCPQLSSDHNRRLENLFFCDIKSSF